MASSENKVPKVQVTATKMQSLIVEGVVYRSSNNPMLNELDLEIASRVLKETEHKKMTCIAKLKEKLARDKRIYRTDDEYLLRYLRFRNYDCDRAYRSIQLFYSKREKYSDVFSLRSNMESLLNTGFATYLPYLDENGCFLFLGRYGKWDPSEVPFVNVFSAAMAVSDITTMNPHCQINGIRCLWDVKGFSVQQITKSIKYVMLIISVLQDCYPWKVKQIILFNCSKLPKLVYEKAKLVVKKKIYERIMVLGSDLNELHEVINPSILPKEYGGALEEEEYNITNHIMNNLPYLKYERSFINN